MLCQLCEELKFDPQVFTNSEHYATWQELVESGENGCELCSFIERDLRLAVPSVDFDSQATSLGPILYNFSIQATLSALNVHIRFPTASTKCLTRLALFQFDSKTYTFRRFPCLGWLLES